MFLSDGEYYEVHYMLEEGGDVEFVSTYRGKAMRSETTSIKCMEHEKKKHPNAIAWEIALYDEKWKN